MRRRAEQVDETRRRIVEATVHLHGTVGPAGTTIAGIADYAGVTRLTVYRHFPDDDVLFAACSQHWLSEQRPPDPVAWAAIDEPEARVRHGLGDLYRFYRHGEPMLSKIYRDKDALPAGIRRSLEADGARYRDVLLEAFQPARHDAHRRRLRAVTGHAVSFATWQSLCLEQRLSDREAVGIMTGLVVTAAVPSGRGRTAPTADES